MTHDELLDKLINFKEMSDIGKQQNALRAVVELHKPQKITLPDGSWGVQCSECDGLVYPCRTIFVVKKELT